MKEERELLLKVSRQLQSMSKFVEGIEQSLSIQVELKALEPQLRAALTAIKQAFESVQGIHLQSSEQVNQEEQEKSSMTIEIQQLKEKVQQLSSLNEELQKPKKRKTKSK